MSKAAAFGLFVSSVEGQPVHRFGAPNVLIGADRDGEEPRKIRYRPDEIVAIPLAEAQRYGREYARAIADGALKARTADEFAAYQQQQQTSEGGAPREEPAAVSTPAEASIEHDPSEGGGVER